VVTFPALSCPAAVEGAHELVNLRTTNRVFPAFGLEVDGVEAEAVFVDDAVDAFVGAFAGEPAGGVAPAAVAHRPHEVEHDLLEEQGRAVGDFVEELGGEFVVEGLVGLFEDGVRRLDGRLRLGSLGCAVVGCSGLAKLPERLESVEVGEGDGGGVFSEHGPAGVGDGEHAAADAGDEPGPFEIDFRPAEPVDEPGLRVAREQFLPLGVGQREIIGDRGSQSRDGPLPAVGRATQEREKHFVEGGNGHEDRRGGSVGFALWLTLPRRVAAGAHRAQM